MTKATQEPSTDPKVAFQSSIFRDVDLDLLIESRRNPRREFGEASMGDLVDSVRQYGVLTPLIVRPVGNDGKYEILAGARRSRAAKLAGLNVVPCRVVEIENDAALEVLVVENLQRKDIHPLEEAEGFHEILDLSNGDVDGLCAKVNKKKSYVAKRLSLLSLIEPAKKLFLQGKMEEPHAMQISRLQKEDQKHAVEYVKEDDPSPQALRNWIESEVMLELSKAAFSKTDSSLVPKAGSCETCPKRTGTSKDLFDDIKAGDRCTDGGCFKSKMKAHIEQLQRSLESSGHKVYGLLETYRSKEEKATPGVLKSGQWLEIKKKDFCENAAKGIFLEFGRAGQYADVCVNREHCKIHGSVGMHGKTPSEREKTRKENLKIRVEKEARSRAFKQVCEKQGLLELDELRLLCLHSFDRLWHGSKISLVKALGWPLAKNKGYGGFNFKPVEKKIESFSSPAEAARFMTAIVCAGDLDYRNKPEHLEHFAKANKVDLQAFRDEIQKELEKKAKKAPKAMSAKTKKVKPGKKSVPAKPAEEPGPGEEE